MKKLFVASLIFGLLFSCTAIKQFSKEELSTKVDCKNFNAESKMMYYDALIDGKNQRMLFDTGAAMSVITDSTAILHNDKKFGALGTVTGADGEETDLRTFTAKFESALFSSDNKVFAYLPRPLTKCQKSESFVGILGLDAFLRNGNIFQMDFSNSKICNISDVTKEELIKSGYSKIKSEIKSKKIFIFINIDGKEHKFKMDTGFSGSVVIPYNDEIDFSKYNSMTTVGNMYRTATSTTFGEEMFYEDVPTNLYANNEALKVHVSKTIKSQNAGMALIRNFDWIIDYENSQVYLKRNKNVVDSKFNKNTFKYLVSEKAGKLIISSKQKQLSDYDLGDEITEVSNKIVTNENICELQDLLNKTQDWSTLNIKSQREN